MHVHAICCNDSIEFVWIGSEADALETMDRLKSDYWIRNRWNFRDEAEYKTRCYWHIHTVAAATSHDVSVTGL